MRFEPRRRPGAFVFVAAPADGAEVHASIVEDEGTTLVVPQADADRLGLAYDGTWAWLSLTAETSLADVGITAAFSAALAAAAISCNVLAALHHDHLLVPVERADDAVAVLAAT